MRNAYRSPDVFCGVNALREVSRGHTEICIAILDGPADLSHPAFHGAQLSILDTTAGATPQAGEASVHGTHIASILFGQPGGPIAGIAPRCRGIIAPIFADGPDGSLLPCSQFDLARAMRQAVGAGAHVISISAGVLRKSNEVDPYLLDAVRFCAEQNVLVVAAAGNDGEDYLQIPSALPSVLAVGAMDDDGSPLSSSNAGPAFHTGILAPGRAISGAIPGGGTTRLSGTSFATAIVSGVAALLLSIQRVAGAAPDATAVRESLLRSAFPCSEGEEEKPRRCLSGKLNATGALADLTQSVKPTLFHPSIQANERTGEDRMDHQQVNPSSDAELLQASGVAEAPSDANVSASCGCGGKAAAPKCECKSARPELVYALGTLSYDFSSEARRDSLIQSGLASPEDPHAVLQFLDEHPEFSSAITWVLQQEETPIYAVAPGGPFADLTYERLRSVLRSQASEGVEMVSIPGYTGGRTTLLNGQVVPLILPELRGIYSWSKAALLKALGGETADASAQEETSASVGNFLDRVYYEIRNFGVASQERALNYSATNAFQVERVFENAIKSSLKLESIRVERSPICRPGSDCWDVNLIFFNPARRLEQARREYRFTVDVSDVVPVTVGRVRSWDVY